MKQRTHAWRIRAVACGLLLAILGGTFVSAHAAGGDEKTLTAVDVKADDRHYAWVKSDTKTLTYDFTSTNILTYSRDDNLANVSLRTNMIFDGETLSCKDGKTFSFGSAIFLGDDYGIYGGDMSFDLKQTGGILSVGLRLSKAAAKGDTRGLWFTFDGTGNMTITSPETALKVVITGISTDGKMTFRDKVDTIEVLSGDTVLATIGYDSYDGAVSVKSADGQLRGYVRSSSVNPAGYFTLYADSMKGTIDNLTFTHSTLTRTDRVTDAVKPDYSNWVAIDDRDRETPTNDEVGDVRANKQVGLFYFLNHTGSSSEVPRDTTYLYNTLGLEGMREYLSQKVNADGYYWAEPYFGYYLNTDEWIQRKHAYMLDAAGVDFIFVDLSNGATYDQGLISLFDTWKAIRDEGGSTPQICIMGASSIGAVWNNVKGYIYSEEGVAKYGDLFYQYKGKPLLMADISGLDAATQAELQSRFTIRHTWAWSINGSTWNWLQEYKIDENGNPVLSNGQWGHDGNGLREELALCMGHHPTTSKGRSYVNGIIIKGDDYGFGLDSGAGAGFANSFEAVKKLDPDMMLITGWNEWTAGLQHETVRDFAGTDRNDFYLVDQFNTEYSRDGEPMKLRDGDGVGFGDNFYYQMAQYIREFKGWNAPASATGQGTMDLSDKEAWANVGPLFTDTANDTEWRSEAGSFSGYTYVNNSGRNDLLTAKVSQDSEYLYFMVNTAEDIIIADDSDWMNLYLNVDGDSVNGWEGFDFVLNRARDGHYVSVQSLKDGWFGEHIGQALYTVDGDTMTIRVSKKLLNIAGTATEVLFKWADNATVDGHVMEFMDKGDTAPNDRYAFRYTCAEDAPAAAESINYKLTAKDGSTVDLRDESTLLPGVTNERPPEETDMVPAPDDDNPVDTQPTETQPTETKPIETSPIDSQPIETKPVDTALPETKPAETVASSVDTDPIGTTVPTSPQSKPVEETSAGSDDDGCGSAVAGIGILAASLLGAGILFGKKKNTH